MSDYDQVTLIQEMFAAGIPPEPTERAHGRHHNLLEAARNESYRETCIQITTQP